MLDSDFASLCKEGGFTQQPYCEQERDEPELCHLTRLAFAFNGREYGRLRALLNVVNEPANWAS